MVRSSISNEVVGSSTREESRLVVRCICISVRGSGYGASVKGIVAKGEGTNRDIVCQCVPHLVSIFKIYIGTTDIVQHITFDLGMMGVMNNDSTLLGVLDGVILEDAVVAFAHFVKMQAVLSLNPYVE